MCLSVCNCMTSNAQGLLRVLSDPSLANMGVACKTINDAIVTIIY